MGRRSAVLVVGSLVFALGACGGDDGGGDEGAFCDSLEVLSEQVADGDLASNDGLEDAVDTANDLLETANGDQEEAVRAVGEALAEADADDAGDTAETLQDELGDLADDCEIDEFAEAPEETTTTTDPDDTTTSADLEDTTTTDGGGGGGELNPVTAAVAPDFAIEAGFEQLVTDCFGGFMQACDDIFFGSDDGSVAAATDPNTRAYGGQCGGRITSFANDTVNCVDNLFAAAPFDVADFEDPSFEALATACKGDVDTGVLGDMEACDDLFAQTGVGTPEELYGDTCGGRIDNEVAERQASCVEIFGATAQFG